MVDNVWVKNGTVSGCNEAIIFFYSQSGKATKMTATGNSNGIFVFDAKDTLIKNNVGFGNVTGIATDRAVGTEIKHNLLHDNLDAAIALESGTDSLVACNTSERDQFGVRIGPLSSGNIVRGNYVIDAGAVGIGVYGLGLSPAQIFLPMPPDNVITKNFVLGSGGGDVAELMLIPDFPGGGVFALPKCLNTWTKNEYGTSFGPIDCIAPPVYLDDDDVCALDDDSDID